MVEIFFPCRISIKRRTTKGCAEISKAAKPLSTYLSDQTTIPFPNVKNKKPAIMVFLNCSLVIEILTFKILAIIKIRIPATIKRIDASLNGGNSVTAILLSRYVEPQITYIAKKANAIVTVFRDTLILKTKT